MACLSIPVPAPGGFSINLLWVSRGRFLLEHEGKTKALLACGALTPELLSACPVGHQRSQYDRNAERILELHRRKRTARVLRFLDVNAALASCLVSREQLADALDEYVRETCSAPYGRLEVLLQHIDEAQKAMDTVMPGRKCASIHVQKFREEADKNMALGIARAKIPRLLLEPSATIPLLREFMHLVENRRGVLSVLEDKNGLIESVARLRKLPLRGAMRTHLRLIVSDTYAQGPEHDHA